MSREKVNNELHEVEIQLQNGLEILEYSIMKVKNINIQSDLNIEELEVMEALTSRFSRLSDIYTQKYLKSFFYLLGETNLTLIDKANYLEKLEIIKNSKDLLEIREMRNSLSHEYILDSLKEMFEDVIVLFPKLKEAITKSILYADNNFKN